MLSLGGVHKSFGALVVTNDVSVDIAEGEAVGIIGPNGAGKSTLFNLIAGDFRPSSGIIEFAGKDVTRSPARKRVRLGIGRTYQIPHPFEGMTVYENTLVGAVYGAQLSTEDADALCSDVLRLTGMEHLADTNAGSLRLLERKRLELARALATKPKLLLLDEIAGGLTDAECSDLIEIIQKIRNQGVTIVWIEHVVHALMNVVERLVVLDRGAILAQGHPQTVMNDPLVQATYFGEQPLEVAQP